MKRAKLQDMTVDQLVERFHRHRQDKAARRGDEFWIVFAACHRLASIGVR